jgi:hypothetical protein
MSDTGPAVESTVSGQVLPPGYIQGRNGGIIKPFQKGQSGNPRGLLNVETEYHAARALCAENTLKAVQIQLDLMEHPDKRIAFLATEAILKRGIGAPRDHSGDKPMRVDLTALSDDQRKSLAEMLRLMFGGG